MKLPKFKNMFLDAVLYLNNKMGITQVYWICGCQHLTIDQSVTTKYMYIYCEQIFLNDVLFNFFHFLYLIIYEKLVIIRTSKPSICIVNLFMYAVVQ